MEESLFREPELVGRGAEMKSLDDALESALAGSGSTVFISGEAGVGKTRLVSELEREAASRGFKAIRGWCLAESMEPLMPIKTALRDAGMLHLVSGDPPPLLVSSYLVDDSGILIAGSESRELKLDPDIFSSMLKAVGDFVKDSMRLVDGTDRTGRLNTLGYGDFKIIMEEHQGLHLACVTRGGFSEQLVMDMREVLRNIKAEHGDALAGWDGDSGRIGDVGKPVSRLIECGKYTGKFLVEDPKLKQENLFDNVLLGLQRASAEAPLLLFLDDLQWSDPTTLKLLHYLARNIKTFNILILGTYRPEDIMHSDDGKSHPLEKTMQEMSREDALEIMELERLDPDCTGKVICSALCDCSLDRDFFDRVHAETGGTPLFILELLKLLAGEKAIARDSAGKWALTGELEKLDIPKKVYDVVERRLDRLTREQREILECAAVIGSEFSMAVLGKMVRLDKVSLLRALADVENEHRLIHSSGKMYRFDHASIREVLYNDIMGGLRVEYHRMVADALADSGVKPLPVNELAHHYYRARDPRAGTYLVKAGDMARERYSNQEAISAYRNSLEFLPEKDRVPVLEKLGDLQSLVGNYGQSLEIFGSALESVHASDARARMLRKMGEAYMNRGEFENALEVLGRAGSRAAVGGIEHAKILFTRGCVFQRKGDNGKALRDIRDSLSIFESSGDFRGIGDAFRLIGTIHWNNGDYDEAMEHYGKSLTIMEEMRDEIGIASALGNMGIVHWNRGELDSALDCYLRSLAISEKIGNIAGTGAILANLGLLYWDKGELEHSLEYQFRSLRMFERTGDRRGIATVLGNISLVHRDNGDLEMALENQKLSLGMRESMGDQAGIALALGNLGELYKDTGDPEKAMGYFTRSLEICIDIGDKRVSIHNLCGMAESLLARGDVESAKSNSERALKTALDIGARSEEAMSRRALGMAHREAGDTDAAGKEFGKAAAILGEIGDRKETARLHYEMALLCRVKGDRSGAEKNMEAALSGFEGMGMRLWAERCREALDGD